MRWLAGIIFFWCILGFFQACSPMHTIGLTSLSSLDGGSLIADPVLQKQALEILNVKCGSCHLSSGLGGITNITDPMHLCLTGLVTPGDATKGRLILSITEGSMPQVGSVSTTELQTLKDWITSMSWAGSESPPLPAGKTVASDPTLRLSSLKILNVNCAGCHQTITSGGLTDVLNEDNLVSSAFIVAGDPTKGRLIGAIQDGTMPKGSGATVTAADLQILKNWVSSMTIVDADPDSPHPSPRPALNATFAGVYANIIEPKCVGCHGPNLQRDGHRYDTYNNIFSDRNKILSECNDRKMPEAPYPTLTATELSALSSWIADGAPNN